MKMPAGTVLPLVIAAALAGTPAVGGARHRDGRAEPDHVVVQHCLIAFKRSLPDRGVTRTKKEAEALADEILGKARAGEDFGALVARYSDDRAPGIYKLANRGVPRLAADERDREDMVPEFGDVAFSLEVGEAGLARYSLYRCPYGFHVIKRLE